MNEDLIQLPEIKDIQDMLESAKEEIQAEVEEDPELVPFGKLLNEVIELIREKIGKTKDVKQLSPKDKIKLAAYLNFLEGLQDDFFFYDDMDLGLDDEELDNEDIEEK